MQLRSPKNLHYPITVTELLLQPGDHVERAAPLFSYVYKSTVTEGNKYGEEYEVEKTFPARFESETDGTLTRWNIVAGHIIDQPAVDLVEIEEPCRHDVQFGGMCANCGKDMTECVSSHPMLDVIINDGYPVFYRADYNTSRPDTTRANINVAHGNTALRVSHEEAARLEQEAKRRLLNLRKLSLVVDLDQTIIHATVDPTVAEWQADPSNPNYDAVKDVRSFQLLDDGPGRGCWYYIKLRPGLIEFLDNISKIYELHIYTMGTRAYAMNIAKIVDPDRRIFGDRILSRDESGSLTAKNLQRLFPIDTKMVVIIDDRGDVWNWSDNLVKVRPYDFFVGIGDINSSFLPKREQLPPTEEIPTIQVTTEAPADTIVAEPTVPDSDANGTEKVLVNGETSTLDQLVSMGGANDAASILQKTAEQGEAIAAQVADRPLLQKQKALDKADEAASEQAVKTGQNGDVPEGSLTPPVSQRHNLLHDDDAELGHVENSLRELHRRFYESYKQAQAGAKGGRIAELRGGKSPKKKPEEDLQVVPDVKEIMPSMKHKVLENVILTFSGVIPLGTYARQSVYSHRYGHVLVTNGYSSDLGRWATSFGAAINTEVHKNTTHVIAARNRRTAKVRVAARNPKIKIVTTQWLLDSMSAWRSLDETPYLIDVEPDKEHLSTTSSISPFDDLVDGTLSSLEEDLNVSEDGDSESETDPERLLLQLDTSAVDRLTDPENDENQQLVSPADAVTDEEWKAMMAEIEDVSDTEEGSEADGDEYQSDASQGSTKNGVKRKRERSQDPIEGEETDGDPTSATSKLQLRKKRALERTSSLTHVATLNSHAASNAGVKKAAAASDEERQPAAPETEEHDPQENENEDDNDDEDDGFDAMFEAELEAQLSADADADANTPRATTAKPIPYPDGLFD